MKSRTLLVSAFLACLALSAAVRAEDANLPYVQESKHYIVKTDISPGQCKFTAAVMDKLYDQLMDLFPIEKADAGKTNVYLFEKPEDYLAYCHAQGLTSAGLNNPAYFMQRGAQKWILVYQGKYSTEDMMSFLYHEATHEFIHMFAGGHAVPLWLNEGCAVYFESSQWKGGQLRTGMIPKARLALLKKAIQTKKHVPLADLITFDNYEKYDLLCYSEGWSLVYFFIHANKGAYGKRLGKYLLMIKDGKDPDAAFKECFPADMKKLQAAWEHFVTKL